MGDVAKINASEAMRDVILVVDVKGARVLAWRMWLAARIIRIAAWVAGCGIEVRG